MSRKQRRDEIRRLTAETQALIGELEAVVAALRADPALIAALEHGGREEEKAGKAGEELEGT